MKLHFYKNALLLLLLTVCATISFAQVPQAMNYQAVLRDANGVVLPNRSLSIRFTIMDSINPGTNLYQETQPSITTNQFGLFTAQIGRGVPVFGKFDTINWSKGDKYLLVELDVAQTGTYTTMGATELISVPYALYAKTAGSANAWALTGNTGTHFGTNYIGTADTVDLMFKVHDTIAGFVENFNSNQSTALGYQALANETPNIGDNNAALGYQALYANTNGQNSAAMGYQALLANTSGLFNTANGSWSLQSNTTGNENTAIGTSTLGTNLTGNDNTVLGAYADVTADGLTNATAIGASAQVSQSNSLVLGKGANVGIGTSSPANLLHLFSTNTDANASQLNIEANSGYGNATYAALLFTANGPSAGADVAGRIVSYYTSPAYASATTVLQSIGAGPSFINTLSVQNGNVGIGTVNPAATLDVEGNVKIADGTQAKDYVLTSDNNGLASWQASSAPRHYIGEHYGGGMVFWVDSTQQHGLIAADTDETQGTQWYNGSYTTTNATSDGVFAGKTNTDFIRINQGAGSYAAQVCAGYQGGGYGDWYLPSIAELNQMYLNIGQGATGPNNNIGGFVITGYWSSTEINSVSAWLKNFFTGAQIANGKSGPNYIRAVRRF